MQNEPKSDQTLYSVQLLYSRIVFFSVFYHFFLVVVRDVVGVKSRSNRVDQRKKNEGVNSWIPRFMRQSNAEESKKEKKIKKKIGKLISNFFCVTCKFTPNGRIFGFFVSKHHTTFLIVSLIFTPVDLFFYVFIYYFLL